MNRVGLGRMIAPDDPRICQVTFAEIPGGQSAEAAWERYRLAIVRHLEAGDEREEARRQFEEMFLTDK